MPWTAGIQIVSKDGRVMAEASLGASTLREVMEKANSQTATTLDRLRDEQLAQLDKVNVTYTRVT